MSGTGVTAIITTYNEAEHIREALQSVAWADEIIVMDSYSTDETAEIVASFEKVRFIQHSYDAPALQKNRTINLAQNNWVFILDADERVTEELQNEIRSITRRQNVSEDGFWVKRKNIVWGKPLKYLWSNDKVIRLIKRDRCKYREVQVHEEIETSGVKIGVLEKPLLHYSVRSIDHYLDKIRRYARWQAQSLYQSGARPGYWSLHCKPVIRFLKHYLIEAAILDGWRGFVFSVIMAWGVWLRYVFLMELWKRKN